MKRLVLTTGSIRPNFTTYIGVSFIRSYSRKAKNSLSSKRSRALSPNVAKGSLKGSGVKDTTDIQNKVGLLDSGNFAKLHIIDKKDRIITKSILDKVAEFNALRLHSEVRDCIEHDVLGHLQVIKPTNIQTLAIRAIQASRKKSRDDEETPTADFLRTFLLAAETGSGKTLAYLAPLISRLKEQEATEEWAKMKNAPIVRSIILLPTLELVSQVSALVGLMSERLKLNSVASSTGLEQSDSVSGRRTDILITTPIRFLNLFQHQNSKGYLEHCKYLVVDEADTLMDDSFARATHQVIKSTPNLDTLVFCSATIPRRFDRVMRKIYPDTTRIVTPGLHKIPRHVDFKVIPVYKPPFLNSKELALRQALYAIHNDNTESGFVKRVIVFVNRSQDIESKVRMLNENGYPAVGTSKNITKQERLDIIQNFMLPKPLDKEQSRTQVLVTNDLMARGVDLQNIRNVILYDMPFSSVDLLHRAGRTGRLGKRGRVLLFIDKKDNRGWIKGLERIVKNGMALA